MNQKQKSKQAAGAATQPSNFTGLRPSSLSNRHHQYTCISLADIVQSTVLAYLTMANDHTYIRRIRNQLSQEDLFVRVKCVDD